MLKAAASDIELDLKAGRTVRLGARVLMFLDGNGRVWPKRSAFFSAPTKLTDEPIELDGDGKGWLGKGYEAKRGFVDIPPRDVDLWRLVGEVKEIRYVRRGVFAPGGFHHEFKRERFLFPDHGATLLYQLGNEWRLDLPKTGVINWRGFVTP